MEPLERDNGLVYGLTSLGSGYCLHHISSLNRNSLFAPGYEMCLKPMVQDQFTPLKIFADYIEM